MAQAPAALDDDSSARSPAWNLRPGPSFTSFDLA